VNPHLMYIWCNIYLFIYLFILGVWDEVLFTCCAVRVGQTGRM
jgi:hypothetical protein